MKNGAILYNREDSLAMITLNNPAAGNIINTWIVAELSDICDEISGDDGIRTVILTGKENFSKGTDRQELAQEEERENLIERLSISSLIGNLDRPTIAAIAGDAFGQGLEMALACDIRICTNNARFSMDHANFGDIPWDGGTQRLARLVGRGNALQMILCPEIIDAAEAYRIGLVGRVVPALELMKEAAITAREIAAKGPIALRYVREAVYKGMDLTLAQGLRLEADLYFLLHTTRDRTEGITAFREKRIPHFTGR